VTSKTNNSKAVHLGFYCDDSLMCHSPFFPFVESRHVIPSVLSLFVYWLLSLSYLLLSLLDVQLSYLLSDLRNSLLESTSNYENSVSVKDFRCRKSRRRKLLGEKRFRPQRSVGQEIWKIMAVACFVKALLFHRCFPIHKPLPPLLRQGNDFVRNKFR